MKNKLIGFVVLLAVLAVGGWYVVSGLVKSPEERVKTGFINLIKKENGHIKSEISFRPGKNNQAMLQEVKVTTDGDFRKRKDGVLELATTFNVFGQTKSASFNGKGEAVLVEGKMFYRIDEMPPIFPDAQKIIGRWIGGASNVNFLSDVLRNNILKTLQEQKTFSEAKKIGNEKVNGVKTTHIQVKLSSAGYASFLAELMKQYSGNTSSSKEQIEKNISQLEGLPLDVWIDASNNLRKVNVARTNAENGNVTDVSIYFSKYEGKLKIEVPQDVIQINEALKSPSLENPGVK